MIVDVLPGGPRDLVVVADGPDVVAAGFREPERIAAMARGSGGIAPGELPEVREIWRAYLAGDVTALERVPVRQSGSPVQEAVWAALREVKPGEPVTYGEMALLIGRPRAARAVGSACGSNRVAPFVPCHRVIAADGRPGGYGYGLDIKLWLLAHEAPAVREQSHPFPELVEGPNP